MQSPACIEVWHGQPVTMLTNKVRAHEGRNITQEETDLPYGILTKWNEVPMLQVGVEITRGWSESEKLTREIALTRLLLQLMLTLPPLRESARLFLCLCRSSRRTSYS